MLTAKIVEGLLVLNALDSIKVLRAKRLIDGTGGEPLDYPVVVVKDWRILDVGEEGDIRLPRGESVEELSFMDGTILPGLIDSHLHIALGTRGGYEAMMLESNGIHLITGVINAGNALAAGITTVKEAGARDTVALDLREGWRRGLIEAPRLLVSGRPLTVPGGHFHFCNDNQARGVEEVRARVRQFVEEDVDLIKIMASGGGTEGTRNSEASFTEEEIRAAVEEAHRLGRTTMAHCEAYDSVGNAARAGVDVLEHCGFILHDGSRGFDEEAAKLMAEKGLHYNPTLQTGSQRRDALRERMVRGERLTGEEEQTLERLDYKIMRKSENLIRMVEIGVQVVAGSDGIGLGNSARVTRTMELMVEAGLTPIQSIVSATGNGAKALRMDHIFGTIRQGLEADILAVQGDPLEDITRLRSLLMVMQSGKVVF
jgi:imidazolonepropionase-like amidohydrolase